MNHTGPVRVAVVNEPEIVLAGTGALVQGYRERVQLVELDPHQHSQIRGVDVVLFDWFAKSGSGRFDVNALVAQPVSTRPKVMVFSWRTHPNLILTALRAGASGHVSKGASALELVEAIERVHAHGEVLAESLGGPGHRVPERWPGDDVGLSPREAEVLALICEGLNNQNIADKTYLGMNTVKTYIRTLYRKIGVESRTQAVLWGIDHGFRLPAQHPAPSIDGTRSGAPRDLASSWTAVG